MGSRHIPRKARARAKRGLSPKKDSSKFLLYAAYTITVFLFLFIVATLLIYNSVPVSKQPDLEAYSSIALSFLLSFFVLSYMLHKGKTLKMIIKDLKLSKDRLTLKFVLIGVGVFFVIVLFSLALTAFSTVTNVQLPTNVQQVLAGTPLYFLIFTFLIAPINEEIFFRGFLVPRLGIIISAVLFAIVHLSYLSVSEFLAAFVFGLIAGYVYKKTQSLYPSIVAHMIVNFITITSLISIGMFVHF
ncbi:MAG: type II CAAX endopeptidase family protein [Candidatus Micrarchaeaceae archaeon]